MSLKHLVRTAGVIALLGCESDEIVIPVTTGQVIQLTPAQAATLVSRMSSFLTSSSDQTLRALGDSARFVLTAGAEARQIAVTTDLGSGPFWAVSLHRSRAGTGSSPQSWSTFHVIAFNEPNNPTRFIVLGGFNLVSGTMPPSSTSGTIGSTSTSSLTAHLFSVNGNETSVWHASAGTSALSATPTVEACPGFTATGMTCLKSSMSVTFNITASVAGSGSAATGQRTASTASAQTVPGVRLAF
jgi:hypothetical protein